ncbi:hypothetical protein NP493_480g03038 [Ridgeia piscesae]|uniref:Nucleolar GTP-binding protein 2 n=1 Tax=Ridgeia piscesae TaxID=27915 RepID=A0AAD9KYA2_RIDPI|nr:hypothetical protein NP493_480g03038 [Ridgeia piscesae]
MAKTINTKTRNPKKMGINRSKGSLNPDRVTAKGGQNMRDRSTIKRLQMYRNFKAKRDSTGKIIRPAPFQSRLNPGTMARVEPNRKWFGNTRVITQTALQTFQEEMGKVMKDPYKVIMRQTKLPISLLNETAKNAKVHILDTESFDNTFGPKAQRKRPNIRVADMDSLLQQAGESSQKYNEEKDSDRVTEDLGFKPETPEVVFRAGQSRRIWGELYKVVDSSDVVVQVLDARDPMGTRSSYIERYLRKEKQHKHLFFILNKCDLVPTWVTQKWVSILSAEYPTLAFHASITNSFGKGALISLLRQFGKLDSDKKQISVSFIGYPNVGKSSIINTLRAKKVCKVAPIAGETKVWQYVTLMKRIFLIDCPGVVYPTGESQTEIVLKGVVRVENVRAPEDYIGAVLERVRKDYIEKTYHISSWTDPEDFLEQLAHRSGKLLKGGHADLSTMAKMVLNDWQRGKLPYFVKPPGHEKEELTANDAVKKTSTESCKKTATTKTAVEKKTNPRKVPKVKQDLSQISVDVNFVDDDIKPLEDEEDVDKDERESESASEMDEENEAEENEDVEEEDDEEDKCGELVECGTGKEGSEIQKTNRKKRKRKLEVSVSEKKLKYMKTASGTFLVSSPPGAAPSGTEPGASAYNVTETDSAVCVELTPKATQGQGRSSKKSRSKQRRKHKRQTGHDDSGDEQPRVTGKAKRQMYEAMKIKKIGQHFYTDTNVKNRSHRKTS